jgi:hypothetical protein
LEKRGSLAKEQEEQQFVTDYIVTKLKNKKFRDIGTLQC